LSHIMITKSVQPAFLTEVVNWCESHTPKSWGGERRQLWNYGSNPDKVVFDNPNMLHDLPYHKRSLGFAVSFDRRAAIVDPRVGRMLHGEILRADFYLTKKLKTRKLSQLYSGEEFEESNWFLWFAATINDMGRRVG
jgi:hypothetical protein